MSRFVREKFLTAMQQDQFVRSRFPHFRRTTNRGDQIKWRGTLQPSPRSDLYEVEIAYEIPCRPHIQVVTPGLTTWGDLKRQPHTFRDGSLCVHQAHEWHGNKLIAETIIPDLTRLLLFVRAGGRCEFDGCPRYLMEHPVTLT